MIFLVSAQYLKNTNYMGTKKKSFLFVVKKTVNICYKHPYIFIFRKEINTEINIISKLILGWPESDVIPRPENGYNFFFQNQLKKS